MPQAGANLLSVVQAGNKSYDVSFKTNELGVYHTKKNVTALQAERNENCYKFYARNAGAQIM